MQHHREIAYLGEDRLLMAFLRAHFPDLDTTWYPDLPTVPWDHWDRIVVIDAGPESFDLLLDLRQIHVGVPAILLVGRENFRLTLACAANRGGAEAVFCKPLCRPSELVRCVADCNHRLDHWKTHLIQPDPRPDRRDGETPPHRANAEEEHPQPLRTIDELCLRVIGRRLTPNGCEGGNRPLASRFLYRMPS